MVYVLFCLHGPRHAPARNWQPVHNQQDSNSPRGSRDLSNSKMGPCRDNSLTVAQLPAKADLKHLRPHSTAVSRNPFNCSKQKSPIPTLTFSWGRVLITTKGPHHSKIASGRLMVAAGCSQQLRRFIHCGNNEKGIGRTVSPSALYTHVMDEIRTHVMPAVATLSRVLSRSGSACYPATQLIDGDFDGPSYNPEPQPLNPKPQVQQTRGARAPRAASPGSERRYSAMRKTGLETLEGFGVWGLGLRVP